MKAKVLVFFLSLIVTVGLSAQELHNGNIVGAHTIKVSLQPGVTMEQFIQAWNEKLIPEMEKLFTDWHAYLAKSLRGDVQKDKLGLIFVINSADAWAKYYNPDNSYTEAGTAANEKLQPTIAEINKLGTFESIFTDWQVMGCPSSQEIRNLHKGNLVGIHNIAVTLKPGVNMDQFLNYYSENIIPGMTKLDPNWHEYTVKSLRGETEKDKLGLIYIVETEQDRDKYYNSDGTNNDLGNQVIEKRNEFLKGLNELGTIETEKFTDWVIL